MIKSKGNNKHNIEIWVSSAREGKKHKKENPQKITQSVKMSKGK
jgi:hypothetical protein